MGKWGWGTPGGLGCHLPGTLFLIKHVLQNGLASRESCAHTQSCLVGAGPQPASCPWMASRRDRGGLPPAHAAPSSCLWLPATPGLCPPLTLSTGLCLPAEPHVTGGPCHGLRCCPNLPVPGVEMGLPLCGGPGSQEPVACMCPGQQSHQWCCSEVPGGRSWQGTVRSLPGEGAASTKAWGKGCLLPVSGRGRPWTTGLSLRSPWVWRGGD